MKNTILYISMLCFPQQFGLGLFFNSINFLFGTLGVNWPLVVIFFLLFYKPTLLSHIEIMWRNIRGPQKLKKYDWQSTVNWRGKKIFKFPTTVDLCYWVKEYVTVIGSAHSCQLLNKPWKCLIVFAVKC